MMTKIRALGAWLLLAGSFLLLAAAQADAQGVPGITNAMMGRVKPVAKVLTYRTTGTAAGGASPSFTGLSIGTATSDRRVIVVLSWQCGGTCAVSSPTVTPSGGGGITLTQISTTVVNSGAHAAIFIAQVTTATTADFAFTLGASANSTQIGVYTATGLTSNTQLDYKTSTTNAGSVSVTTVNGGFLVAVGGSSSASALTWSGPTSDFSNTSSSNYRVSGAHMANTSSSQSVSQSSSATEPYMAAASW